MCLAAASGAKTVKIHAAPVKPGNGAIRARLVLALVAAFAILGA
jgi:hypothetical protein